MENARLVTQVTTLEHSLAAARGQPSATVNERNSAAKLDFPDAIISLTYGSLTVQSDVHQLSGERTFNAIQVNWQVVPSHDFGDEYVVTITGLSETPKTLSGTFKGGYLLVGKEDKISISVAN